MPTLAFAMCGSFCTFEKALAQLALLRKDWDMLPVMSETAYTTDTRFGTAESFHERIENICGRNPSARSVLPMPCSSRRARETPLRRLQMP